jgi:hypothetical protein
MICEVRYTGLALYEKITENQHKIALASQP